jgi:hypothetical protein
MNGTGNDEVKPQFEGTLFFEAVNPEAEPIVTSSFTKSRKRATTSSTPSGAVLGKVET